MLAHAHRRRPESGQGHPLGPAGAQRPGRGSRKGRHCASGSRVAEPGGPALPAVPEIVPPSRATRARNAPAGRTWCSGARRRRLRPRSGAAGHQHPTPVRSPAASEPPAVPAQPEPRAYLTSQPPPRLASHPLAGRQAPRMRTQRPAPPPRAARSTRAACRLAGLGWVCRCPLGSASAPPDFLSSPWG